MAQPTTTHTNGLAEPEADGQVQSGISAKRKRDPVDEGDVDMDGGDEPLQPGATKGNQKELIRSYYEVLSRYKPLPPKACATLAHHWRRSRWCTS